MTQLTCDWCGKKTSESWAMKLCGYTNNANWRFCVFAGEMTTIAWLEANICQACAIKILKQAVKDLETV